MFTDGANFTKSVIGSVWIIFCLAIDLPPLIRSKFCNIIKVIYLNSCGKFNFNDIFDKYLIKLKTILKDGIFVEKYNTNFIIHLHALIADSPARSKICNTTQFNGDFGCLFCYHPGNRFGKRQTYNHIKYPNRTNNEYLNDVNFSERTKAFKRYKG